MTSIFTPQDPIQRQISLDFIRTSGAFAVEANANSKVPLANWSPKDNNKDRSDAILARAVHETFNIGAHLFGDLADVDVDTDDPAVLAALDLFLPPCGHIWGRLSRPRTHRVYRLREPYVVSQYPIMGRIKKKAKVELRGGELSRGQYSLLPGSVHPSGEHYFWHDPLKAQATLTVTTAKLLIDGIRKATAAAAIAAHWTEGCRHDLALALSGFLHRVWSMANADGGDKNEAFAMDREQSMHFLRAVCELAGDDKKDVVMREKAFKSTWDKAENGASVTGATRITEITGDKFVAQFMYDMLSDNPNGEKIDEFLDKFAIRRNTTDVIDLEAMASGAVRNSVMPRQAFAQTYAFEKVNWGGKPRRIVDIFFEMSAVRRISGIDVNPAAPAVYQDGDELIANAWAGFEIPPHPTPVTQKDVAPFVQYIRETIADHDEARFQWAMAWLADIFQRPALKSGTALVLVGRQGAGKSMLGYSILMPIIGPAHSSSTNSVDRITRSFNVNFANKVFIQCDEAINNRQKATAAKLKNLVTDPTIHIEPKGVNGWDQTNLARFLFTSNDRDDALFISDGLDDRRYSVFEVNSSRAKDLAYWADFHAWLGDRTNLAKIHRWLADWKYDPDLIRRAISTKAKVRMAQQSMDQFDEWLTTWISEGHPVPLKLHTRWWHTSPNDGSAIDRIEWPMYVNLPTLVEAYEIHCRNVRRERPEMWSAQQLRLKLAEVAEVPEPSTLRLSVVDVDDRTSVVTRMRPRVHRIPTLKQVQEYISAKYGIEFMDYSGDTLVPTPETAY